MPPKERTLAWEAWFDAPPARIWPLVADTDRVDRLAGLPPATYTARPGDGPPVVEVAQTYFGVMRTAYEETPFEWVEADRFAVVRTFSKGPVTRLVVATRLVPEARGTRVVTEVTATPRSWFPALLLPLLLRDARRGHLAAHRRLAATLTADGDDRGTRRAVARRVLERLRRRAAVAEDVAAPLATLLATADAGELARLRPFALADRWRVPRREVLAAFLEAVRAGVLELSWESLCPHCRGAVAKAPRLAAVRGEARCEACAADVAVALDRNLEAVFRPAADLRRVDDARYCIGGPGSTPHVVAQATLAAGASRTLDVTLGAGAHRVRVARRAGGAAVAVEEGGAAAAVVRVGAGAPEAEPARLAPGRARVVLENRGPGPATVLLERTAWLDDVATAFHLVAMPGFPDVFAADVLAPGERVAVQRVAVLFTDLRGSTALYRRVGDAAAYALVRDHFRAQRDAVHRHEGHVVKTIGDAVMAAFRTAGAAVAAALDMAAAVAALPVPAGEAPLALKAGVHVGPSIAVNGGGVLDYFGTTTNLAARAQHEAQGGDVVLTEAVAEDEEVAAVLAGRPHVAVPFTAALKGFDRPVTLRRVRPA